MMNQECEEGWKDGERNSRVRGEEKKTKKKNLDKGKWGRRESRVRQNKNRKECEKYVQEPTKMGGNNPNDMQTKRQGYRVRKRYNSDERFNGDTMRVSHSWGHVEGSMWFALGTSAKSMVFAL